ERLVVHRGERAFVLLNRFPYSSGHLMTAPYRHGVELGGLDDEEALELHHLAAEAIEALRATMRPDGFNVGWNLGRGAGAGVVDPAHPRGGPRGTGDTNFRPAPADVRVTPDPLVQPRRKLADAWPRPPEAPPR